MEVRTTSSGEGLYLQSIYLKITVFRFYKRKNREQMTLEI